MNNLSKELQLQYEGFLKTPFLWQEKGVFGLQQFKESTTDKAAVFNLFIDKKPRLGKLVERFVSFNLSRDKTVQIIAENIQIQQNKITLGELDCILLQHNKTIHLEIIYKFYLYDNTVGNTEIEHFIGPNRKDSLIEKLTKLKEKQLPLLYSDECNKYLNSIHINPFEVQQQVYFKAQIFFPLNQQEIKLSILNQNCVSGFYIYQHQLPQFKNCKFYIPTKHNWLIKPKTHVNWLNFKHFQQQTIVLLSNKKAPLCWIKYPNGKILKFFIVWWDF